MYFLPFSASTVKRIRFRPGSYKDSISGGCRGKKTQETSLKEMIRHRGQRGWSLRSLDMHRRISNSCHFTSQTPVWTLHRWRTLKILISCLLFSSDFFSQQFLVNTWKWLSHRKKLSLANDKFHTKLTKQYKMELNYALLKIIKPK